MRGRLWRRDCASARSHVGTPLRTQRTGAVPRVPAESLGAGLRTSHLETCGSRVDACRRTLNLNARRRLAASRVDASMPVQRYCHPRPASWNSNRSGSAPYLPTRSQA